MDIKNKKLNKLKRNQEWSNVLYYLQRITDFNELKGEEKKLTWKRIRDEFENIADINMYKVLDHVLAIHYLAKKIEDGGFTEDVKNELKKDLIQNEIKLKEVLYPFIMNTASLNIGKDIEQYRNDVKIADSVFTKLLRKAKENAWGYSRYKKLSSLKAFLTITISRVKKDAIKAIWAEYSINKNAITLMSLNGVPQHIIDNLPSYKNGKFQSLKNFRKKLKDTISSNDYYKFIDIIESCLEMNIPGYKHVDLNAIIPKNDNPSGNYDIEDALNYGGYSYDGKRDIEASDIANDLRKAIESLPTKTRTEKLSKFIFLCRFGINSKKNDRYEKVPLKDIAVQINRSESYTSGLCKIAEQHIRKFLLEQGYAKNGS